MATNTFQNMGGGVVSEFGREHASPLSQQQTRSLRGEARLFHRLAGAALSLGTMLCQALSQSCRVESSPPGQVVTIIPILQVREKRFQS